MEHKLKKMMKKIEDALAAASFAEAGESETARSMLREGRRVLLAIKRGRIDAKTVKYGVNASKRIGADLDILYVSSEASGAPDPLLDELEAGLFRERVKFRIIRKTGCLKQAVIDYTNREKEVVFAVVESANSLEAGCKKKNSVLSELWQKLKCPLVVVMDEAGA